MKFVKNNPSSWASEESFKVYSGSTLLYTSPEFANSEVRTIEQCLATSTNNQYSIELLDSYGDSWTSGSYLTIFGENENVVFKNFLTASSQETYTFSLYYGVAKSETWKMTYGSISGDWTAYSFSDSTWEDATLGSVTTAVSGTQYFRKQFVGLSDMAAYDVRLYYKAGVIAYINGAEVYRDNMPDGDITSTTAATGQYTDISYHGFIRPGSEVASQQSILAVEVHFVTDQTSADFNAYLAILASSVTDGNCFIYGESTSVSSSGGTTVSNAFDFAKSTYYYAGSTSLPDTITFTFDGARPYVNALRVWPYTLSAYTPSMFTWQGSNDNQEWTNILSVSGASYESSTYQLFTGYFYSALYNYYRANIVSSSYSYVYIYELQPLICATSTPTSITFTPNTYTVWAKYEEVSIQPDISEFTSCTAENLPAGLSIDSTTCVISGKVSSAVSSVSIAVTSVILGNTYTGSFTITAQECSGTMLNVLRTYQSSAYYESFDIKDSTTQEVVISVAYNSGQENNVDWTSVACVTGTKYTVSVATTLTYWQASSFLYVRSLLSSDDMETILRIRYDSNIGFPSTRTFNAQYAIETGTNWYYKHGEVPSDWYSSTSTDGWTEGNESNFLDSTNQIQLYKKTFTISDISNIAGFVLSIKYMYGCIVYLNGNEAFRKGLTDTTISTSSYANNIYTDTIYRQVSLPIKTVQTDDTSAVNLIQQGSNMIAIGLVAANANQVEAIFDCALRLMAADSESRVFDYTNSYNALYGYPTTLFNQYYYYYIYYSSCADNYLDITFNNDRHEWINAVTVKLLYTQSTQQPHQFVLKARSGSDDWTTLTNVTGLTWSQVGQTHTIYFQNNKAYHEYRFENFGTGDSSDCYWQLGTIDMSSVCTTMVIPELSYEATTVYKNIEMGEVYPNSEYYFNFQVTPSLPAGISLDPNTGMISGTATETSTSSYTITAEKLTGGTSTTVLSFTVAICTGGRSLITLVARTDSYPTEASYKVYQGVGTSGTVVASVDSFSAASSLNYGDFCLEDNIYTLQLLDSYGDGWYNPAGYYLTIDLGTMIFEMGQLPSSTTSVSTMFSSFLPFQIDYSDWNINYDYAENWYNQDYDDSAWTVKKASEIGLNTGITTYIRKEVNIPDISSYHILNVRVKYTGGVAVYFNGRLTARFNLEDNFNSESQSTTVHSQDEFSKFHVIMSTVGGVTGKNVIAFEIHRPTGQSSSSSVVFDATGVFGVNDCSIAVDTFSNIDGSDVSLVSIENLLDLNPTTYGYQSNSQGTYLEWTVENLEGTKFNSFGMQTVYALTGYGFSLYVRMETSDEYISALELTSQSTQALSRSTWSVPVGIAGFEQLRFEVDVAASSIVYVSSYMLLYCKPSGSSVCPGIGDYPSVGEGEISPAGCEEGYRGYSYRTCTNGQLGEISYEYCTQKLPDKLIYDSTIYNLIMDTNVVISAPEYVNIIEEFYMAENTFLPTGLSLNTQTGEISGIPTEESTLKTYTIYGKNQAGITYVTINISVQKGTCKADGNFPTTNVGEVYVYDCALGGSYVGTQKRACKLGETNGEWQSITGYCMPVAMIIILVVIAIIIIAIVVFLLVRVNRKAKAVGGVKGKSVKASPSSKRQLNKKEGAKKAVKV